MGNIRRSTILSSLVIYIGFIIGFINTYLYVKNGSFSTLQYGLTRLFNDIGATFFSFATLGVISYIHKFQPYYKQNLDEKENDQAFWSVLIVSFGFLLLTVGSIVLKPFVIRKFSARSGLLISYYYWILPYAFGILFFSVFEAFAWFAHKSILTNFLKETGLRIIQSFLILAFLFRLISFDIFIKIFSFSYLVIATLLVFYLVYHGHVHFNLTLSRVTRKFYKKMISLMSLIYGSLIINTLGLYVDAIIIASISVRGLSDVGVYTLATFIATTIVVPQRSIIAATIPVLSRSWKKKDYTEINRIYHRTSINLLALALFAFCIIWLNIDHIFTVMNINKDYEAGKWVILILGLSKIIDAGTGVNAQIIGTSIFWRFEMFTGILLLSISIPLNYILVKHFGINGSAISNLISFSVYNFVRLIFIYKKFCMQPFNRKTLYAVLSSLAIYGLCFLLFGHLAGWLGIIVRSFVFFSLYTVAMISLQISPDIMFLYYKALKQRARYFEYRRSFFKTKP